MYASWEQLEKISIFEGLKESELNEVFLFLDKLSINKGNSIVREGEEGNDVYIVISGYAQVFKSKPEGNIFLSKLGPNDCFGEMALLETTTRSATVEALEDMVLLRLPPSALQKIKNWQESTYSKIIFNIAKIVSSRLRAIDELYAEFGLVKGIITNLEAS